jgi:WD40 repeat protein
VVALAADQRWEAVVGPCACTLRLWDLRACRPHGEPFTAKDRIEPVVFSPKGHALFVSAGPVIYRWLADGRPTRFAEHEGPAYAMAFSPDGQLCASGTVDDSLRVWNLRTRRELGKVASAGQGGVRTLALSADGRRLATGALTLRRFPQVCLWDVTRSADNVRPVCPALPSKHHGVESLAFSPNGEMLASASPVQRTAARQTRRRWSSSTRSRSAPSCASAGVGSEPIGSGDRDESRRRSRHRELLESRSRCMGGV